DSRNREVAYRPRLDHEEPPSAGDEPGSLGYERLGVRVRPGLDERALLHLDPHDPVVGGGAQRPAHRGAAVDLPEPRSIARLRFSRRLHDAVRPDSDTPV